MNLSAIPSEVWHHIFESITHQRDLARVVRTCRLLYRMAIRSLYIRIAWNDPRHLAENLAFLQGNPALSTYTTSLRLQISGGQPRRTLVTEVHVMVSLAGSTDPPVVPSMFNDNFFFHPSRSLYTAMLDRILIFTNLKELAVHDVRIPDELYEVFHRLPSLRRLCIRRCQVGHQVLDTVNEPSASSLAIHELTLRDLTMTSHHLSSEDLGYSSLYMLSAAPHLRALSIEWNSVAARYFSGPHRLSSHLRRVDINVVKKSADDGQALMAALVAFIIAHPSVVHLSITNISLLDLPIYALPNLRSYTGPPFHSLVDAESRPLVHLELIDSKGLLLKKLSTLPTSLQRLRSLSLFIPCWNDEVLHAVVFHFPRLRALEIAYRWLHPSEHTLLSMGSQFLCRIPELHTVKVYNYGLRDDIPKYSRKPFADYVTQYDDSENERFERHESEVGSAADDATGALQELILAWRHWCPSIRVVQLWHSFLWRRSYDGGAWVKRTAIRDRFREARSCWPFAEVVGDDEEAGITCHARYADPA